MLGFAESISAWLVSTTVPAFLGLALITAAVRLVRREYLLAFALGIFLWFSVDTWSGSADLSVNAGFNGGVGQFATVILFAAGVLVFFGADRNLFSPEPMGDSVDMTVPFLVALAIGIHGLGEGAAFGGTASVTTSTDLLGAFGGISAGVSYALHKALEPMMIGACYLIYSRGGDKAWKARLRDVVGLALVFAIPSLLGAITGYYIRYDATYFFALGAGTSIYAALRIVRPLFLVRSPSSPLEPVRTAFWLIFGLLCIYSAALLHA